ncbi:MAG: AAA family ATPase [Coprococcus sp.]
MPQRSRQTLQNGFCVCLLFPQKLMELQVPYKNAALLYGPPGTGKTLFAKYIAYKKRPAVLLS